MTKAKAAKLSLFSPGDLPHLISTYGYWVVVGFVALEGMGIPVPGETALIAAAIIAGTSHGLGMGYVIAAAIGGAVLGDNVGFWIGRAFGYRLLLRCGQYVGLTERKIKLGRYLFLRYGSKLVFVARFVAVLRAANGFLAGANRMDWRRFFVADAAGATLWSAFYGLGAYLLGKDAHRLLGPFGMAALALAVIAIGVGFTVLRRNLARLEAEAERALPGPLRRG